MVLPKWQRLNGQVGEEEEKWKEEEGMVKWDEAEASWSHGVYEKSPSMVWLFKKRDIYM